MDRTINDKDLQKLNLSPSTGRLVRCGSVTAKVKLEQGYTVYRQKTNGPGLAIATMSDIKTDPNGVFAYRDPIPQDNLRSI